MKVLIDGATASNAVKVEFELKNSDFKDNSLPAVKTTGLGTGDSINIYEKINDIWQVGQVLDEDTISTTIRSVGLYAVDIVMATAGPVSVGLNAEQQ